MRIPLRIGAVALLLAGLAYLALQRPEIRVLFESTPPSENPLDFLDELPEVRAPETRSPDPAAHRAAKSNPPAQSGGGPAPEKRQ